MSTRANAHQQGNTSPSAPVAKTTMPGLPARRLATVILTRIIDDGRNLDQLTDHAHGLEPWLKLAASEEGRKDQNLVRAMVVASLRHRGRILAVLQKLLDRPLPKNARLLHHALAIAAAQILFMDVPDSAAVNIAVATIGQDKRTERFKALANGVLRNMVREKEALLSATATVNPLPDWLAKQLRSDYGKEKSTLFGSRMMLESAIDLSVRSNPENWAERLDGVVLPTGTVRLKSRIPIQELEGYDEGEWWVQDAAAAIPARLLGDVAGLHVADFCAAPGGKTAQLLCAGARVTSVEQSAPRLKRLEENLARLKLSAQLVEADIMDFATSERYDRILLDAPCSSTGTMRRNPDVAWTRHSADIVELAALQMKLIVKSAEFLKPGGMLVFANCSVLKAEGEDLFAAIAGGDHGLQALPLRPGELPLFDGFINGQGAIRTLPTDFADIDGQEPRMNGLDSFFACRFVKSA